MVAGCGSGSTPTVASAATPGSASGSAGTTQLASTGQSDDQQVRAYVDALNKFSACMRAKGFLAENHSVQEVLSKPKEPTKAEMQQSAASMAKPGWPAAFEACSPLQLPEPAAVAKA